MDAEKGEKVMPGRRRLVSSRKGMAADVEKYYS